MFFSPTLLTLTSPHLNNDVRVICLSSGNSDGIGGVRRGEFVKSCRLLGVDVGAEGEATVYAPDMPGGGPLGKAVVVEDEALQDGMGVVWDSSHIATTVQHILRQWSTQSRGGAWVPSIIITFDTHGISSHTNHISAYYGAKHYIHHSSPSTKLYTLTTTNLPRKYLSILDFPITYLSHICRAKSLLLVLGSDGFKKARGAMTDAHVSQMRWFRWGWIWLSRYMVVNDFAEEDVLGAGSGSGKAGKKEL